MTSAEIGVVAIFLFTGLVVSLVVWAGRKQQAERAYRAGLRAGRRERKIAETEEEPRAVKEGQS